MTVVAIPGRVLTSDQLGGVPNQEIIDAIKGLLVDAERGHIQAISFATVNADQSSRDNWICPTNWDAIHLIGGLECAKARLLNRVNK